MKRIKDKISQINEFLDQLGEIAPSSLDEYKSSIEKKAACERYVEKIVEAVTDLAFLIIKNKSFRIPEDDIDAFNILLENQIINSNLAARLKNAKGMRNIISHQYGKIDDEIVFHSITEELEKDVREFIGNIKNIK
ncbi:DUF86 domain-containing protein [Candidatus Woesearchaeota archaeon]|nr:DUF86 domain-containing protein [Candidatus Woesearchaeota archaeon]